MENNKYEMHGTTIIAVQLNGKVAMAGDGQVTLGQAIVKGNAIKVRRIFDNKVVAGFAGSTADAFTLLELFEGKLQKFGGNLMRSAVELAKDWRTDKMLRVLEAMMIVTDGSKLLLISGNGDVLESSDGILAIGSGGNYALAAARAMMKHTSLSALEIAKNAINIAGEICVYTNTSVIFEEIGE